MKDEKLTILCVDDDPDVLDSLRIVLESRGYTMVGARSAEEGLEKYSSAHPDLLMIDLMMEEVDSGTTLVTKLQALGNTAPVYMLSSVGEELQYSVDPEKLGLAGVFQKPLSASVLLKTLDTRLKR
jgi:DNA-binding response OmpR family regulator